MNGLFVFCKQFFFFCQVLNILSASYKDVGELCIS